MHCWHPNASRVSYEAPLSAHAVAHHAGRVCTTTGLTPATSATGMGSPRPHLHQDSGHICTRLGCMHRVGAHVPCFVEGVDSVEGRVYVRLDVGAAVPDRIQHGIPHGMVSRMDPSRPAWYPLDVGAAFMFDFGGFTSIMLLRASSEGAGTMCLRRVCVYLRVCMCVCMCACPCSYMCISACVRARACMRAFIPRGGNLCR